MLFSSMTGMEVGKELETFGLRVRLSAAIEKLKDDERSHKLARRLDNYTDVRGSVLSCTFSSNACEIAISNTFFQITAALYGSGLILYGAYVMANPFLWYGERTTLLWANYFVMAPLNEIGLGILVVLISYSGRYKSPLVARRFAQRLFTVHMFTAVLALLVEILQHALHMQDPAWTWMKSLESGFLIWIIVCIIVSFMLSLLLRYHQEYFIFGVFIYCGAVQLLVSANTILDGGANKYVGYILFVSSFASFAMVPILFVLWLQVRREASAFLSRDVERFNKKWKEVKEIFNLEHGNGASDAVSHRSKVAAVQVTVESARCKDDQEAFRRVLLLTRRISSIIKDEFLAQSRKDKWVSIARLVSSRFDEGRRYSFNGKARQRSSNIDQLFAQAASINEPIQQ
eukprot:440084-Hanusia_phi.AAC.1